MSCHCCNHGECRRCGTLLVNKDYNTDCPVCDLADKLGYMAVTERTYDANNKTCDITIWEKHE